MSHGFTILNKNVEGFDHEIWHVKKDGTEYLVSYLSKEDFLVEEHYDPDSAGSVIEVRDSRVDPFSVELALTLGLIPEPWYGPATSLDNALENFEAAQAEA